MDTGHHFVSLRVKSVLDSVDTGAAAGGMVADDMSENSTHDDCGGSDVSSSTSAGVFT